jgi:hypothetical protein
MRHRDPSDRSRDWVKIPFGNALITNGGPPQLIRKLHKAYQCHSACKIAPPRPSNLNAE